ncbi:hypothetical protein JTE90_002141 [Oedothorax gibbosus]|uniref:Uncharacterized protein n=1 Tax=Oedothorax gibbosus TaxID=931172 RepID=A0AAV6V8R9_9ARAC|nr:hypothetical protein JTE90_002141 [Oedothorax gibbosus]
MNEADISVQPTHPNKTEDLTSRINEVKIFVQSPVPMTVANISSQSTAPMHDVDNFVEPIHEAGATAQPTDLINEAGTSVQPTEQINEADLSSTEEYQEAFRIFQWIEIKLDILKKVQGNDENADNNAQNEYRDISLIEKSTLLKGMLEEISQQMTSTNIAEKDDYFSKEVTRMLNKLQETTQEVLDNLSPTIKVLSILIHHLVSNIGSKVTFDEVQKYIDGPRVMKLFTKVQIAREPRYLKISIVKRNLELGVRRAQYLKRESNWYKSKAEEWIDSACARTVDVRSANQQLKTISRESEVVLTKYRKSVKFVLNKAKVLISLQTDNEEVLTYFLTTEINDMYKKET